MRIFPITALCAVLLVACEPVADPAAVVESWPATRQTEGGSFSVTLAPSGGEILNNEHFSLDLAVEAKKGGGDSIKVVVDADMPAHGHGMNTKPELADAGVGKYKVDGMLFHMAGEWMIFIDVSRGEVTERASFPVLVE